MQRAELRLCALTAPLWILPALSLVGCSNSTPSQPGQQPPPAFPALEEVKRKTAADYPDVPEVGADTVAAWQADAAAGGRPLVLLDVREPKEFAVSSLRGARQIDPGAAASALDDLPRDARIVCYCSVGVRSAILTHRLQQAGFSDVHNLNGSIFEWANTGHPVYQGDRQVQKVHPYDKKWGELLRQDLHSYDP